MMEEKVGRPRHTYRLSSRRCDMIADGVYAEAEEDSTGSRMRLTRGRGKKEGYCG